MHTPKIRRWTWAVALIAAGAVVMTTSCRPRTSPPSQRDSDPHQLTLPEAIPPFTAGALVRDPAFVRRTYQRGSTRITVTLARYPLAPAQYDDWVTQSASGYPQATLDVPAGSGNGFYECSPPGSARCNLLIQLRAGVHVEIRGDGSATRADVDAIARGLPLAALATP